MYAKKSEIESKWVNSIAEVRGIFWDKTEEEFIEWYSDKYRITENRVYSILEHLKEVQA